MSTEKSTALAENVVDDTATAEDGLSQLVKDEPPGSRNMVSNMPKLPSPEVATMRPVAEELRGREYSAEKEEGMEEKEIRGLDNWVAIKEEKLTALSRIGGHRGMGPMSVLVRR